MRADKQAPPVRNVSLVRALSKLGYTSRSQAAVLVRSGAVRLNGSVVTDPALRCDPSRDKITVGGKAVREKRVLRIILNKPAGVVTTRSDERGRKTVYDCLGPVGRWIFPVGRLDRDTEGLLLMTNDHQLGQRLTDPSSGVPKTYRVKIDKPLREADRLEFEKGMMLDGVRLLPAKIKTTGESVVEVIIHEGKNRQIRRMFAGLGYTVVSLCRTAIGGYTLAGLAPGEWKEIDDEDVRQMLS